MTITNAPVAYDTTAAKLQYNANGTPVDVPLGSGNVPVGGTTGQVLAKNSSTNYDTGWTTPSGGSLPTGGTVGQALLKNSSTNGDASWYPIQIINQVYINFNTSTSINISAYDGQTVQLVDGPCVMPTQPFRIDNTGLSANTNYYLYGHRASGVLAAEWSTTSHSFDSGSGLETKNADTSRILLGMIRTNGSSQFVDSQTQRFVLSWAAHDREDLPVWNSLSGNVDITSSSFIEVHSSMRLEGLTWGYGWNARAGGSYGCTAAAEVYFAIATGTTQGSTTYQIYDGGYRNSVAHTNSAIPWSCSAGSFFGIEGYYFITVVAKTASGTLTVANGANSDGCRSGISAQVSRG